MTEKKRIIKSRINKLLSNTEQGIFIFVSGQPFSRANNIEQHFNPDSNFFYFTGLTYPETVAIIKNVRSQKQYVIFGKEATEKEKVWNGDKLTLSQIKEITGADAVYPIEEFSSKLEDYLSGAENLYYSFGIDESIDHLVMEKRNKLIHQSFIPKIAPIKIYDLGKIVENIRIIKDKSEISSIKKAVKITEKAYNEVFKMANKGMWEYEIEAFMDYMYRKENAHPSFPTIVASGANGTVLHYIENSRKIEDGDMILLDSGAQYENYCADVTRTWPVSGKFTQAQKEIGRAHV